MVMKKLLLTIALAAPAGLVHAGELRSAAADEYQACLKESEQARKECSFGGCGNILGACYERQIAVFENDSAQVARGLKQGACAESAETINEQFAELERRLLKVEQFNDTWSGLDLRVELAAAKNRALSLAAAECATTEKVP